MRGTGREARPALTLFAGQAIALIEALESRQPYFVEAPYAPEGADSEAEIAARSRT